MKTSQENNESELQSRNAQSICNGNKEWLLFLPKEKNPLLGIVHAATKEEALERVAVFGKNLLAVPADAPVMEQMTPEKITRQFELFCSVIPAATDDPGRQRTTYFYRQQALAWARMARQRWTVYPTMGTTCKRLAKTYLTKYRTLKGTL
jgi:molybdopterin-guanine dinucleotide biosynthesis protein A